MRGSVITGTTRREWIPKLCKPHGDLSVYDPLKMGVDYNEYRTDYIPLYEDNMNCYFYEVVEYENDEVVNIYIIKK